MIVLDTNVVSELMRPQPSTAVDEWVRSRGTELVTTSVTVAEIGYGIARLPTGSRRTLLQTVANEVFAAFGGQVLPFDAAAAGRYGEVVSSRERAGTPIDGFDAQIAAICLAKNAALATRNTKDFVGLGIELTDPWEINEDSAPPPTVAEVLDRAARRGQSATASALDALTEARRQRDEELR